MKRRRAHRGFTLLEIMVVLLILGAVVGLVGVNVLGQQKDADRKTALIQMKQFAGVIKMYYIRHRTNPATLDDLTQVDPVTGEALMERIPLDPWGRPYDIRPLDAGRYRIRSLGEDGDEGTDDDVVWPEEADS